MKRKYLLLLLFVVILSSGCAPTVPETDYLIAQAKIGGLQSELVSVINELAIANNKIENLRQENDEYEQVIEELQAEYDELKKSNDDIKQEKSSLQAEKLKLEREINSFKCTESLADMQYETILNVSDILSGWMARQSYVVRTNYTYRDTIWNNTDTKIHSVQYLHDDGNTYVDHFLVYFDEFGWTEGVFWLSGQCWLTKE